MLDQSITERFEEKYIPEPNTGCWLWMGHVDKGGYGAFTFGLPGKNRQTMRAHRISYMMHVGRIPEGKVLDHTCRVRCCVNPQHLEPVTNRENVMRGALLKTHCPQGHPYSGDNLYLYKGKHRQCRECQRAHDRKYWRKKRASGITTDLA